jgi:hypothetical protein
VLGTEPEETWVRNQVPGSVQPAGKARSLCLHVECRVSCVVCVMRLQTHLSMQSIAWDEYMGYHLDSYKNLHSTPDSY